MRREASIEPVSPSQYEVTIIEKTVSHDFLENFQEIYQTIQGWPLNTVYPKKSKIKMNTESIVFGKRLQTFLITFIN